VNYQVADYQASGFVLVTLEQTSQEAQHVIESGASSRIVPLGELSVVFANDQG
jgi:hypothetical protein